MSAPDAHPGQPSDVDRLRDELAGFAGELDALRDAIAHLAAAVDSIEETAAEASRILTDTTDPPASADAGNTEQQPPVDLAGLAEWVRDNLACIYSRPVGALRWCSTWWEHPEAITRLEACRRAWVDLASQPGTGLSVWHRDHLDPMLAVLLSPVGPFRTCEAHPGDTTGTHRLPPHLPLRPLPAGLHRPRPGPVTATTTRREEPPPTPTSTSTASRCR